MDAKIEKISELSKLLSVKTRMSDDLFHLFGKFGIGHLLSRLSLEKHDGVSASELILSLCLSRIVGESIHRICKPFSYVPMFFLARRTCLSVIVSSPCLSSDSLVFFATLRQAKIPTWQNPDHLFVAQVLKKFNL